MSKQPRNLDLGNGTIPTAYMEVQRDTLPPLLRGLEGITCAWVIVTPSQATDWLVSKWRNRNLSDQTVLKYAIDMEEGRWVPNGQPIIFSDRGQLIDGQHRLSAVALANVSVPLFIVRGVSEDHASTIDQGRSRSAADSLKIEEDSKRPKLRIAVVRVMNHVLYEDEVKHRVLTNTAAMEKARKHRATLDWAVEHFDTRIRAPIVAAACLYYPINTKGATRFVERFMSGEMLSAGDPELTLRQHVQHNPDILSSERIPTVKKVLAAIDTSTKHGGQIKKLQVNETVTAKVVKYWKEKW